MIQRATKSFELVPKLKFPAQPVLYTSYLDCREKHPVRGVATGYSMHEPKIKHKHIFIQLVHHKIYVYVMAFEDWL